MRRIVLVLLAFGGLFVTISCRELASQEQKIEPRQRENAVAMLSSVHGALKKNYYDPTFHGIDVDARYKAYQERINKSETVGDAFRTVAAYLSGLNDSHTFFIPPRRSYSADYGYRMQIIGEGCYITEVRPGSDAAERLHPGDQVVSLNGYAVGRKDIWQLEYYLRNIAPKPATEFTLRAPSGEVRKVQVLTKFQQGKHLKDANDWDLTVEFEKEEHLLRERYIDQGDVMFWKMPAFEVDENAIDQMIGRARKHKKLILDLRGNPGGYVTALMRMVGSFFSYDVTIDTQVMRKEQKPQVAKSRGKNIFTGDLVVLIDSNSASAAELFARVIQLEHRGTVVGDRSSGSVMEARMYPFHEGWDVIVVYGASITMADLIMRDGKSLENVGVTPDVMVMPSAAELAEGQDPALARAARLAGIELDPAVAGGFFPFEWAEM